MRRLVAFGLFLLGVVGHMSGTIQVAECAYYVALAVYVMALEIYDKIEAKR